MTIEPKPEDAPPPVEKGAPKRFYRVGPTWLDLSAVVAVGVEDDGFTLHLSSGQTMPLPAAAAETVGVLKRLGLPKPKAKGKRRKKRKATATGTAGGVLAAIAGFLWG